MKTLTDFFYIDWNNANYLINWSLKNKIIYVETPKVACTTIKKILQFAEVDYNEDEIPEDVHDRSTSSLKQPAYDEQCFLECLQDDEYFIFSFVRNPITRCLSSYLDKIVRTKIEYRARQESLGINAAEYVPSFGEFVDIIYNQQLVEMDIHWAPQTLLLGIENVRYDYLGRFEHFRESIDVLMARAGVNAVPKGAFSLGKEHATRADEKLGQHYSPRTLKKVQEIYADDFRYLGYGWTF